MAVYHEGLPDEVVVEGIHEGSQEVKDLWLKCQEIRPLRRIAAAGHPRGLARHFPFSRVLHCHCCDNPYYGEAVRKDDHVDLRLCHERRGPGRHCSPKPRSRSVPALVDQMGQRVMPHLKLDDSWKTRLIAALRTQETQQHDQGQLERLRRALEALRKQHL